MTKKRRKVHAHLCRSFSLSDVRLRVKRVKHHNEDSTAFKCSKDGASPETVANFQAFQRSPDSVALADVFEWLGDALLGELVGRCILSQFYQSPLSARVFRNLRLAVVSNRNLAQVYDAMGYGRVQHRNVVSKSFKMKDKADAVEAVVGELVMKLHQQETVAEDYRVHLDVVLATMLHTHFADQIQAAKKKDETRMTAKGPLSVAFNPFTCLPEEQLDETTGELVVTDGVFDEDDKEDRTSAHTLYDFKEGKEEETGAASPHHYFTDASKTFIGKEEEILDSTSAAYGVKLAMIQVDEKHILRTSSEIFQVFKIYGMAVLSERASLSLALRHVLLGSYEHSKCSDMVTPAILTRQRQLLLSVANLAACATSLGIAEPVPCDVDTDDHEEVTAWRLQEEHGLANTLRAFVGFHSAVAITPTSTTRRNNGLVDTICTALYDAACFSQKELNASALRSSIVVREPLMAMMRSVSEARMFMGSKTCDNLHKRGERPVSDAALEFERNQKPSLLLRQYGIDKLEDLFETLNEKQEMQQKESETAPVSEERRKKRPKKKKVTDSFAATAGCMTRNLERFLHRRFLFCLEQVVILFAQHKTEACRAQIAAFEHDLMPCADQSNFRKWEVSTSTLTLAMRDSFFRMLLHDICQFHAIISSSRNTRDGNRTTQLRLPLHYTWTGTDTRVTSEQHALT